MKTYILIGLVAALMLTMMAVSATETASVTVDGWKFATDLPGWRANDDTKITPHNAELNTPMEGYGDWTGFVIIDAAGDRYEVLYCPAFPNSPKGIKEYYADSAKVGYIAVVNLPKDVVASNLELNIAVYGSADKIPDDRKKADLENLLKLLLTALVIRHSGQDMSDKIINFKGFTAYLVELGEYSAMSVLLDDNTIAIISVWDRLDEADGVPFKGTTFDIMKSLTITKA